MYMYHHQAVEDGLYHFYYRTVTHFPLFLGGGLCSTIPLFPISPVFSPFLLTAYTVRIGWDH